MTLAPEKPEEPLVPGAYRLTLETMHLKDGTEVDADVVVNFRVVAAQEPVGGEGT